MSGLSAENSLLELGLPLPSDRMVGFFSVTSTLDGERIGDSPKRCHNALLLKLSQHFYVSWCMPDLAHTGSLFRKFTWTAIQFESRLDSGDGGDNGSVWHDGSVHVDLLGGGERGA